MTISLRRMMCFVMGLGYAYEPKARLLAETPSGQEAPNLSTLIHPFAGVSKNAKSARDALYAPMQSFPVIVKLGNFVIFNALCWHRATIRIFGDGCTLSPFADISGVVNLGKGASCRHPWLCLAED